MSPGDSSEGAAVIPSDIPSVASVRIQDTNLSPSASAVQLTAAGTIAAEAIQITGSAFTDTTAISLTVSDGSTHVTVNVPVTVESDTLITNTEAVTVTGISSIDAVRITIKGAQVYSWMAYTPGSGDEDSFG